MEDDSGAEICPRCGFSETAAAADRSPLALAPRTLLHQQYSIGRVLGHGGFGITYLAWDVNLNMKLAIKEYLPSGMATRASDRVSVSAHSGTIGEHFQYGLEKFLDEGRALARFNGHPGIVSVLNFFRENKTGYLVMSYVDGITFKEYLAQAGGKVSYEVALKVLMPVMDALAEVHRADMLHRDVSPDNIYVTRAGQVKILDFGAARFAVGEQSRSISVILKPGYAPEEQYRTRGRQGPWTDVYALGATFYRALTGKLPPESLDRLAHDDLEPPSALGVAIPATAEEALLRALAVRVEQRLQSVQELQSRLLPDGMSFSISPVTLERSTARGQSEAAAERADWAKLMGVWRARVSSPRGISLAAAVLAAVGAILAFGHARRERPVIASVAAAVPHDVAPTPAVVREDAPTPRDAPSEPAGLARASDGRAESAAPAEAKPMRTLTIVTKPPGAQASVDGVVLGKTPLDDAVIGRDAEKLRLELPGYRPVEMKLSDDERAIEVTLAALPRGKSGPARKARQEEASGGFWHKVGKGFGRVGHGFEDLGRSVKEGVSGR